MKKQEECRCGRRTKEGRIVDHADAGGCGKLMLRAREEVT
jgi:hypothetical protein